MKKQDRMRYVGKYDDAFYWARVHRNLGWLGDTEEEQRERQSKLRDAVVGIAGCGGIGGSMVERLTRLGVLNLKIADPDAFEPSNINRQLGAGVVTIGRNKAEVVAEHVFNLTRDVNIEVYPEGIIPETVDEFVAGCDYILDEIDPFVINARYVLHRAFRKSDRCRFLLTTFVFGYRTFMFKWTRESMPVEEYLGIPADAPMNEEAARRMVARFIPDRPPYPGRKMFDHWFIERKTCPIIPGCPPLAQGVLTERIDLAITGMERLRCATSLPTTPGYVMFDGMTWETKVVNGKWW